MPFIESRLVLADIQQHEIAIGEMFLQPRGAYQHRGPHNGRLGSLFNRLESSQRWGEHSRSNQGDCSSRCYRFQHRFSILNGNHSVLSSATGSSFATRVRGTNDDAAATVSSKAEDAAKVTESRGPTPKITPDMELDNSHAAAKPAPSPAAISISA